MIKVLFVCTGNICRSPMAEYVFQDMVKKAGLSDQIMIDSAGISDEEVGNTIHNGTVRTLAKHSIPHNARRPARQITNADFADYDYLLAMDRGHLNYLQRNGGKSTATIAPFLSYAKAKGTVNTEDVPDPWYDGQFDRTYDLVTKGCTAFLAHLRAERNL